MLIDRGRADSLTDVVVASPGTAPRSGYLPTLDGWRAVAILGVIVCHGVTSLFRVGGPLPHERLAALTALGAYGVQIFFGISGFLITIRLIEEHDHRGTISLRDFYVRRALRILPASFAYLLAVVTLQMVGIVHVESRSWIASLLFFKNFVSDDSWYLSHFWSLAVEEQFYFFWPALLVIGGRSGATLAAVVGMAICIAAGQVFDVKALQFDGILAGCLLALLFADPRAKAFLTRWLRFPVWLALLALLAGGILGKIPSGGWWMSSVIAVLVAGTVLRSRTLAGRVLELKPLRSIGRWSYSLYLWQELFCLMNFSPRPFGVLQEFPLNIVMSFGFAFLSFRVIEQPLIRLGHKLATPTSPGRGDITL